MGCAYKIGTKKTRQVSVIKKKAKPKTKFLSFFGPNASSTSHQAPSVSPPEPPTDEAELEVDHSGVELTIFTAFVDVKLSTKVSAELHRSMRKNPPRTLKYELIYVCCPLTSVTKDINTFFRRGKTHTMQARKGMTLSPRQRIVSSKEFVQTWKGEYPFWVHVLPLTLT